MHKTRSQKYVVCILAAALAMAIVPPVLVRTGIAKKHYSLLDGPVSIAIDAGDILIAYRRRGQGTIEDRRYLVMPGLEITSTGRYVRIRGGGGAVSRTTLVRIAPSVPLVGLAATILLRFCVRRRLRRKRGCCAECAYDLTDNISGVCPECGTGV